MNVPVTEVAVNGCVCVPPTAQPDQLGDSCCTKVGGGTVVVVVGNTTVVVVVGAMVVVVVGVVVVVVGANSVGDWADTQAGAATLAATEAGAEPTAPGHPLEACWAYWCVRLDAYAQAAMLHELRHRLG